MKFPIEPLELHEINSRWEELDRDADLRSSPDLPLLPTDNRDCFGELHIIKEMK